MQKRLLTILRAILLPQFTEVQYVTVVYTCLLIFVFSAATRAEFARALSDYLGQASNPFEAVMVTFMLATFMGIFVVTPTYLALRSALSRRPLGHTGKSVVGVMYYALYGVLALISFEFFSAKDTKTTFDLINHYFTLAVLILIVARWFFLLMTDTPTNPYVHRQLHERQYHYSHFVLILIASPLLMSQLLAISNIAVVAFLAAGYTLTALTAYDGMFRTP